MIEQLKDNIIYVDDITAIPSDKLYKRLYYQTTDTASYRSGIWWHDFTDGEWKRFHQVTIEVGLSDPENESWEEERSEQSSINKDIMEQLRSIIIEYNDLNSVPTDKLYRRIYRQLNNTFDRKAGLYYRDFDSNVWIPLDGDTSRTALSSPATEKWEIERATQAELNRDIVEELRKIIIEYENLDDVPSDKLYRRLYHQTTDTADRAKGIYYWDFSLGNWIPFEQDTVRVGLTDPTVEKWEVERTNQKELNEDILYNLVNDIISYGNLNLVPDDKLYKRIYRQTADTTDRKAGLYWYNFEIDDWVAFDGDTVRTPLTNPLIERFHTARETQAELNRDIVEDLREFMRSYEDLDTVPSDEKYRRIYRQTTDTAARKAGLYYWDFDANVWVAVDPDVVTEKTYLSDPTLEKWEEERTTQQEFNIDVAEELRKIIIEVEDIDTVELDKLYRRIYRQRFDTATHDAGLYYYNFDEHEWVVLDGDTKRTALHNIAEERWEEVEDNTQYDLNKTILDQLDKIIIESADLTPIEEAKIHRRIYRQTVTTPDRKAGLYWYDFDNHAWIPIEQDTATVYLNDVTTERWEDIEDETQQDLNRTILAELKKIIIEYKDLADVPDEKLYRRIYRQLEDSADRKAGLYYWDFEEAVPCWKSLGGYTASTMVTDPLLESMTLEAETQAEINEENKKIINRLLYMPTLSKVDDWLFETDYKNAQLDEEFARAFINKLGGKLSEYTGGCSMVYRNGFVGKNFDFPFNWDAQFAVKVLGGLYDYMGVASGIKVLSKDYTEQLLTDKSEWSDVLRALPYYINEGQNVAGLFVGMNVVPAHETLEGFDIDPTTGTGTGEKTPVTMLPALTLQRCASVSEVKAYVDTLNLYCPADEELHLMFGDGTELALLEFINNTVVWTDMNASNKVPYMTNYYQTYAVYGSNMKLADHAHIGEHPNGVHRGDIIADNYSSLSSVESILDFLQDDIKYTNTYTNSTAWIDEFCGNTSEFGDLTIEMADTNPGAFMGIIAWAQNEYNTRSRDTGTTWQTVFSAVNDVDAKKMYVIAQERGLAYKREFTLVDEPISEDMHILVDELPVTDINEKAVYLLKTNGLMNDYVKSYNVYDGTRWWTHELDRAQGVFISNDTGTIITKDVRMLSENPLAYIIKTTSSSGEVHRSVFRRVDEDGTYLYYSCVYESDPSVTKAKGQIIKVDSLTGAYETFTIDFGSDIVIYREAEYYKTTEEGIEIPEIDGMTFREDICKVMSMGTQYIEYKYKGSIYHTDGVRKTLFLSAEYDEYNGIYSAISITDGHVLRWYVADPPYGDPVTEVVGNEYITISSTAGTFSEVDFNRMRTNRSLYIAREGSKKYIYHYAYSLADDSYDFYTCLYSETLDDPTSSIGNMRGSVLRINTMTREYNAIQLEGYAVKMTQAEYDSAKTAGTLKANTFYAVQV